jgi:hypothetical protein
MLITLVKKMFIKNSSKLFLKLIIRFPTLGRVLYFFNRDSKPKKWLFIVGCYNSGTTLLDFLLAQHPLIDNLPTEGVALYTSLPKPEDYKWPRMSHMCALEIREKFQNKAPNISNLIRAWTFWVSKKCKVVVEKSISNSYRINWLNENFNEPLFIWVVRNGYCVSEGIRRRSKTSKYIRDEFLSYGYPIELCAAEWSASNALIFNSLKDKSNYMIIKYEDLVDDPEKELERVYKRLSIINKKVPKLLNFTFQKKSSAVFNMNKKSFSKLSCSDFKKINSIAGNWLNYFNYKAVK